MRLFCLIGSTAALIGCSGTGVEPIGTCTDEARAGISVSTLDAKSGQPVSVVGTVIVREGQYSETAAASAQPVLTYYAAYERPGTYTVTVNVQGYQQWQLSGVRVTRHACHVGTVPLAAQLTR
jgi:hypothetical protein